MKIGEKKEHTPRIFEVVIVPYVRVFDEEL
jgi:hypothetical protein